MSKGYNISDIDQSLAAIRDQDQDDNETAIDLLYKHEESYVLGGSELESVLLYARLGRLVYEKYLVERHI
jgi:hypothetical protein